MLIWITATIVLIIAVIFVIRSISSKARNSSIGDTIFPPVSDVTNRVKSRSATRKHIAADVLPNVERIRQKREFNWQKLHENINPTGDSEIQSKLVKLIREEREYIIVDKFIYFAELDPNCDVLQVLNEVEQNALSYREILGRLGDK